MLNKHRVLITTFLIILFSTALGYSRAQTPNILKIALLDSPYNEMPLLPVMSEYEKAYFAGIETATRAAKQYNIEIKYKSFIYGVGALDILGELSKVQQWRADLVIGPNSSDQFLLLRNHFSDQDNWSHEVDGHSHHFDLPFESYRIGPVLFDDDSTEFKNFSKTYYETYHTKPTEAISYLTYVTVMSAVDALHQFPTNAVNMREHVLHSYLAALHKNPNWFRSRAYGIYQLTSKGEVLIAKLPDSKPTVFLDDAKKQ